MASVNNLLKRFTEVTSKVLNDCLTSANGDYDPARVVGYGIVALGGLIYLVLEVYMVVTTHQFDEIKYSTGLAGVGAALVAAAGGVWLKKSTEVPPKEPPQEPPHQ